MWRDSHLAAVNIVDQIVNKSRQKIDQQCKMNISFCPYVSQNSKRTSTNLIAQSIKIQPYNNSLQKFNKPENIKRDNLVSASATIIKNKKFVQNKNMKFMQNKNMKRCSTKKIMQNSQLSQKQQPIKLRKKIQTILRQQEKKPIFFQKQDEDKTIDNMRQEWLHSNTQNNMLCQKSLLYQKRQHLLTNKNRSKNKYNIQIKDLSANPYISKQFPVSLKYQHSQSKQRNHISNSLKKTKIHFKEEQQEKEQKQVDNLVYNNSHCRQTSNIPYIQIEEGVCITEPNTLTQKKNQSHTTKNRMSCSFFKYKRKESYLELKEKKRNHSQVFHKTDSIFENDKKQQVKIEKKRIFSAQILQKNNQSLDISRKGDRINSINDSLLIELIG